ncbi:hypothetical protein SBA7_1620004 [Candidatus Sulfotelmatobacter sp. SbA7]|jgi:hypothetical protein|nr:hypothetical protein SBA7_1620004 [Candidatus Sulfotelmatobacter sp. SbA7]
MKRYSRANEKFTDAMHRLLVGEGDARQRLRSAYRPLRTLHPEELPEEMREEFNDVLGEMTRYGPLRDPDGTPWRSAIDHTMGRIRNATARRLIERLATLRRQLDTITGRRR